jgi:methionyl-tRNA formyltransferase
VRLVFAGTPQAAVPSLRALLDSDRHEVVAVVTRPDAPAGRGRRVSTSPVKDLAVARRIEVVQPPRLRDADFLAWLERVAPDCCPVVAYGALIPRAALDVPSHGWVNLHFSLLPAWRGAAPVQHAILAGDEVTGASTFLIEEGLDTGPVFGVVTEPVGRQDTSGDLLGRLSASGAALLVSTIDGIADATLVPRPQPSDGVSLAPKITVEDARVDWRAPALRVDRQVRACTPDPGAWTTLRGSRLKLGPVVPVEGSGLAPGEVAGDRVGTGGGEVTLGRVKPEGKAWMDAAAWRNGARLLPHERLE